MQHPKQIPWQKEYEVGVEDIDLQHHYFVNLINRIGLQIQHEVIDQRYLNALINELNAYAKFHFSSEETMMIKANYPDYEMHKNHHLDLVQRLSIAEYKVLEEATPEEVESIINFLMEWFLNHTRQEDKAFADYLITQQPSL